LGLLITIYWAYNPSHSRWFNDWAC